MFITNVEGLNEENLKDFDTISFSEMNTFLQNKREWFYRYMMGFEPVETPSYFSKGRYLHSLVANMLMDEILTVRTAHELTVEQMQEDGESLDVDEKELVTLQEQATQATKALRESSDIVAVESEFYVTLGLENKQGNPVLFHGFVDATVSKDGELWIVEHKTGKRAWSDDQYTFHYQDDLYALALSQLGDPIRGSTYIHYLPKRLEYKSFLINDSMQRAAWNILRDVTILRDELSHFPIEWSWGGGSFAEVYRAEVGGGDAKWLLESQFTQDEERLDKARRFRYDYDRRVENVVENL